MQVKPFARPFAALALAAAALGSGCGGSPNQVIGPVGDAGGVNLAVYASDRNQAAGMFDLYLYDLDQLGFRVLGSLNTTVPETDPSITGDGQYVAFVSARATGAGSTDIYLFDRGLQGLVPTPGLNTAFAERTPRFTGNAQRLAFGRDSAGVRRIRLYEPIGDTLITLPGIDAPAAGNDEAPAPNSDGSRIAFQSDRGGMAHVYVWDRPTGGLMVVPAAIGDSLDVEPALSSNGQFLCFASTRSGGAGGYDLYLYDLTAMAFLPLPNLNSAGNDRFPSINGDATRIVFQSDRTAGAGKIDLYVYSRAGSGTISAPVSLSSAGDDVQPSTK